MLVDMWPIIIERLLTGLSAAISYINDRDDPFFFHCHILYMVTS